MQKLVVSVFALALMTGPLAACDMGGQASAGSKADKKPSVQAKALKAKGKVVAEARTKQKKI